MEQARVKYRNLLEEDKNKKREYGKNRYRNISEEKKKRLNISEKKKKRLKEYQKKLSWGKKVSLQ